MVGTLQPLDQKFAIVDQYGNPTEYFTRWAQQKQIDIEGSIQLSDLVAYLLAHPLIAGQGIGLTPDGNLADSPKISVINGTGLDFDAMHNLKLADTAVTPGTYGDATHVPAIVVDQQGRITGVTLVAISGGGGSAWDFVPPLAAGFTLTSGDATNLALADDTNVGLLISSNTPINASLVWRYAYKTLTNKALDWTLVTKIRRQFENRQYHGGGISFMDSVSGRITHFDLRFDGTSTVNVSNYTNLTTFSSSSYSQNAGAGQVFEWQRVRHTGGNYYFDFSPDGKQWGNLVNVVDTSFLTNRADRVGITGYSTSNTPSMMTCGYWSLTGPGV